ncbi:SuhB Archaeal fructose-1,6-bisphosphatase and related enzymes of inositol monophosphatase family [Rhabdaerophilaceae bacterium]
MRPVDLNSFIETLARQSGEAILPFFRTNLAVQDKGDGIGAFDPVTEADRAAESVIRRRIHDAFPTHGIVGEEFADERLDADYIWVIDPIDGTRAFLCGLPVWGTLIGLMRLGNPVLGVMHQPYTGELFFGDCGSARVTGPRGERQLVARDCTRLADATLMTTDPRLFNDGEKGAYLSIERSVRLARYGADCYAYAMLAAGQVDLVIETGLKPYDIVALIPIIEGAGGVVTTWSGQSAKNGGQIVAAATPTLHAEAMALLAGA